jgi:hypothetical protein
MEAERRLIETERRWQTLNKQMVPVGEVAELGKQMVLIFCKHETDPRTRAADRQGLKGTLPRNQLAGTQRHSSPPQAPKWHSSLRIRPGWNQSLQACPPIRRSESRSTDTS